MSKTNWLAGAALANSLLVAGCFHEPAEEHDHDGHDHGTPVTLSGVIYAPGGTTLAEATILDKIMDQLFGKQATAALTGSTAVDAGITVNLVDTTLTGDAALIATATTASGGAYQLEAPAGFVADPKYVVRAGTDTSYIEARVLATTQDVDPLTHVTSQLVSDMTSDAATNLATLNTEEVLEIASEVELLLPETESDFTTETTLSAITTGLKNAVLNSEETANVIYSTTTSGKICGTVTGSAGQALESVVIVARDYTNWVTRAKTKTDASGAYCLSVPVVDETINGQTHNGEYILGAINRTGDAKDSDLHASEWWTAAGGAVTQRKAEKISLTSTAASVTKDFQLALGARISGTVYATDGITPLEGIAVLIRDFETWYPAVWAKTKADGTFRVNVPAGNYIVIARNRTRQAYASEIYADGNSDGIGDHINTWGMGGKFDVVAGNKKNIKFNLQAGVKVTGTVLDGPSGNAVSGVRVRFDIHDDGIGVGTVDVIRSNKDGKFRIWLAEDQYDVRARGQIEKMVDLATGDVALTFETAVTHKQTIVKHNDTGVAEVVALLHQDDGAGNLSVVSQEVSASDGSVDLYFDDTTKTHYLELKVKDGDSGAGTIVWKDQSADSAGTISYAINRTQGDDITPTNAPATINLPDGVKVSGTATVSGGVNGNNKVIARSAGGSANNFTVAITRRDGSYEMYLPDNTPNLFACYSPDCSNVNSAKPIDISDGVDEVVDFTLTVP